MLPKQCFRRGQVVKGRRMKSSRSIWSRAGQSVDGRDNNGDEVGGDAGCSSLIGPGG